MKNFEFNGSGRDYFKIWIVNILLIIITFGMYYPWAKIKDNRYLYANSMIDGRNFDYYATAKQLIFGYLIVLAFVIIYVIVKNTNDWLAILFFWSVFFLVIPWFIYRSMRFNLSVTSFNNGRFKFIGSVKKSYLIFLGIPILTIICSSLIFALFYYLKVTLINAILYNISILILFIIMGTYLYTMKSRYYINHSSYENSLFKTNLEVSKFLKIILKTIFLFICLFIVFVLIEDVIIYLTIDEKKIDWISEWAYADPKFALGWILSSSKIALIVFYMGIAVGSMITFAYFYINQRKYIYENTTLYENINFKSNMKFLPYSTLLVTNFFMILFTFGLAFPWAKVRIAKYTLENTVIVYDGEFPDFSSD